VAANDENDAVWLYPRLEAIVLNAAWLLVVTIAAFAAAAREAASAPETHVIRVMFEPLNRWETGTQSDGSRESQLRRREWPLSPEKQVLVGRNRGNGRSSALI
jgi:hypothetical protein